MDLIVTSKQRIWTANQAIQISLRFLLPLAGAVLLLLAFATNTSAFKVISEHGEGTGQTRSPTGLAVDYQTGRLYVVDAENNRVDVFDKTGAFEHAFGWGVKNSENKFQTCTAVTTCRKGLEGSGEGQFRRPTEIAVDNSCFLHSPPLTELTSPTCKAFDSSDGDVYVVDNGNLRVEKFDMEGNFILTFGGGVDQTVPGNVCTAESGDICGAGSDGFEEGGFSSDKEVLVGVGPAGTVYVVDIKQIGDNNGDETTRMQRFQPSGTEIAPQQILSEATFGSEALAVDSSGDFYVDHDVGIRKYEPGNDTPIAEIPELFEEGALQGDVLALAVDAENNLFAGSHGFGDPAQVNIMELDPTGKRLRRFGFGSFDTFSKGLAPYHSASGDIYASEPASEFSSNGEVGYRVLHLDFPEPGPLVFPAPCKASPLGNTTATLSAEVNPEGKASTYHFQYVTDAGFQHDVAELGPGHGFDHATRLPEHEGEDPSLTADFKLHSASAEAALVPETKYHCRVLANSADGTATGDEGTFTSLPPVEIGPGWTSGVGTEAATLNAEVNPLGIPTTGYFEYVIEATYQKDTAELGSTHGFDHATKIPDVEKPIDFGADKGFKARAAVVSGLKASTAYRYRLIATDSYFPAGFDGPTEAFRTYAVGEGALPDDRAWELVSPAQKNSAEVAVPGVAGGLFDERHVRVEAAAGSGEAVTYTSWTSFGNAEGAPSSSQYLSKRTPSGWGTENISPFGFLKDPIEPPFRGFTGDLGFGAFVTSEPPLTAEAQEGFENLYLRNDETGQLQALTVEEPQTSGAIFCAGYAGASSDGKHAFFAGEGSMAGAPVGKGFSLYEWSAGGEGHLKLVSVLPDGTPAPLVVSPERSGTGFGAAGGTCTMDQGIVHDAISEDGQTVFWSYGGEYENPEHETSKQPLFVRIDGKETIQLDAKPKVKAGKGPFGQGRFEAATPDGSKAFFEAPGKLTKDAEAVGGLYRYDTVARSLIDLTPGAIAPEFEGLVGVSDDGAYAYFVAKGVLTGEEANGAGEKAAQGANNLYVYHEGEPLRFIAALSNLDAEDWTSAPVGLSARVTPDGRHLALLSIETKALSGYDNTISPGTGCQPTLQNKLEGDPHCAEAYLYDADSGTLVCASCNPAGSRPTGPAQLPGWTNPYEGPRYLADDGSRLFFESRDVLSAADQNGRRDVYEFEREGAGSCDSASPGFDQAPDGCISLISSGKSTDDSYLLDASSDGRDVFLSTRSSLVGWDTNENYDVYDARERGGFPEPPQAPASCEAEACKPPTMTTAAVFGALGSMTFSGTGNVPPKDAKPVVKPTLKPLTRAQKLAKALKRCKKEKQKAKRALCEKSARKKDGRRK